MSGAGTGDTIVVHLCVVLTQEYFLYVQDSYACGHHHQCRIFVGIDTRNQRLRQAGEDLMYARLLKGMKRVSLARSRPCFLVFRLAASRIRFLFDRPEYLTVHLRLSWRSCVVWLWPSLSVHLRTEHRYDLVELRDRKGVICTLFS